MADSLVTKPPILNSTGQAIAAAIRQLTNTDATLSDPSRPANAYEVGSHFKQQDDVLKSQMTILQNVLNGIITHPIYAASYADMKLKEKLYIYNGEDDEDQKLFNNHWYYYGAARWNDGGNFSSLLLDASLVLEGAAAEAKATGEALAKKLDILLGTENIGKFLKVNSEGNVGLDNVDTTLTIEGAIADAKATGEALAKKLDVLLGTNHADKLLKVNSEGNVDFETIDKTLSIEGAVAEAKTTGKIKDLAVAEAQQNVDAMKPNLVKGVTGIENGIKISYWDDSSESIPVVTEAPQSFDNTSYYDTETQMLHLCLDGEDIIDPIYVPGGSGGGGGGLTYTQTLNNTSPSRTFTVAEGTDVKVSVFYSSVDSQGSDDGAGVGTITVNNVRKGTVSVQQGNSEINLTPFLSSGSNSVKIRVENSEGSYKTLTYTITIVALSISTTNSAYTIATTAQTLFVIPSGSGVKTIHYLVDGNEIGTIETEVNGRSISYVIPMQSHGSHIVEVYATTLLGAETIRSNTLTLSYVFVQEGNTTPIVSSTFTTTEATEGETLSIPYLVYNPTTENATVVLSVIRQDGTIASSSTLTNIGRTAQIWSIKNYPAGNIKFRIAVEQVSLDLPVEVAEGAEPYQTITDSMILDFNPIGRSNSESNPAVWSWTNSSDPSITASATFSGIGFSGADGWLLDSEDAQILRILPGGEMTISTKVFETDAAESGLTIEAEIATHNVRDYDSIVINDMADGRGFKIASQYAELKGNEEAISMQFKEDEKVRVSFVIQQKQSTRLYYVYINGIMCGVKQYTSEGSFIHPTGQATGITIGAESSGIDIYRILVYKKELNPDEVLENYIADRPNLSERLEVFERNNILEGNDIVINKLPLTLPYMIISSASLPQAKKNKTPCSITFVNPSNHSKDFTADGAQIDVQGTSSAVYYRKNFKIYLNNGVDLTLDGTHLDDYKLRENSLPVHIFCLKADVASSEGTNNVELVRLYCDTCTFNIAQEYGLDSKVRQGIDGFPMVVFWQNTTTGVTQFWGKYNFNNDKETEDVFGFTPGCESWEFKENINALCLFQTDDFTNWEDAFEARYPDKYTNYSKLEQVVGWVYSTYRAEATNNALPSPVTYEGVTYTSDTSDYRLAKFKAEFEDHFVKDAMLYFYVFTEVFLMVDNRAKNMFLTTYDGTHWMPLPYDFDTALGINNEGQLTFDYDLEDTDLVDGKIVFNGQNSVLWNNFRDAFGSDIAAKYVQMRAITTGTGADTTWPFSYDEIVKRFSEHQAVWPERIWNEDGNTKYIEPYINGGENWLYMLQGNKASQFRWWLFNGLRYRDSKYRTQDAENNVINLRCYAPGDVTLTPYSHIWLRVKCGSRTYAARGKRNIPTTLNIATIDLNDTETYIYSADRLSSIGDLSGLQVGYAEFSKATKLQSLKLGDGSSSYQNNRLNSLTIGNNELLTSLDIQNCTALTSTIDLHNCIGLETVLANGSSISGVSLPVGGKVKTLELPATIVTLTIRNQRQLEDISLQGYGALRTLHIDNTVNVPIEDIVLGATGLERVRLQNVIWDATSESTLEQTFNKFKACGGLEPYGVDEEGNVIYRNTDDARIAGTVNVPSISGELLEQINTYFPELVVCVNGINNYVVRYLNYDSSVLYRYAVQAGANAIDPVAQGLISTPTQPGTNGVGYTYDGWESLPTNIQTNVAVIAKYKPAYLVKWMNGDTVVKEEWVATGGNATAPSTNPTKASTAQYSYTFTGWSSNGQNITQPTTINAQYSQTLRSYTVRFYNGSTLLESKTVNYGSSATYSGSTPQKTGVSDPSVYEFTGWDPSPTNITGNTDCYAQYRDNSSVVIKYLMHTLEEVETSATNIAEYGLANQTSLTTVDLTSTSSMTIAANAFNGNTNLTHLIIRSTIMATLNNTSAFTGTKIAGGEIAIYVPANLVDTYKADTNWKNYFIAPISSYPLSNFDTITDSWADIIAAAEGGTIGNLYNLGNYKTLRVNNIDLQMQLVGLGKDDLADDSGKAASTWIVRNFKSLKHTMNSSATNADGWAASGMRDWLINTILPTIDSSISSHFKSVKKTYWDYTTTSTLSINDTIWIPSCREIFGGDTDTYGNHENSGCDYTDFFSSSAARIKNGTSGAAYYWTRSARPGGSSGFRGVGSGGAVDGNGANSSSGAALGFCI